MDEYMNHITKVLQIMENGLDQTEAEAGTGDAQQGYTLPVLQY